MSLGSQHIGNMDRRIKLQSPTESRDATYNQIVYGYSDVATVWAALGPPALNRSSETEEGSKITQTRMMVFYIRYSTDVSGINEKWRILFGADSYEVADVYIGQREGYIRISGEYKGIVT